MIWLLAACCAALYLYRRNRHAPVINDGYMSREWINDHFAEDRKDREGVWWPKEERGRKQDRRRS